MVGRFLFPRRAPSPALPLPALPPTPSLSSTSQSPTTIAPPKVSLIQWVNLAFHTIISTIQQLPKTVKKSYQNQCKLVNFLINKLLVNLSSRVVVNGNLKGNHSKPNDIWMIDDVVGRFAKDVLTLQTASRHATMQVQYTTPISYNTPYNTLHQHPAIPFTLPHTL